jgi:uncharacterized membrane protein
MKILGLTFIRIHFTIQILKELIKNILNQIDLESIETTIIQIITMVNKIKHYLNTNIMETDKCIVEIIIISIKEEEILNLAREVDQIYIKIAIDIKELIKLKIISTIIVLNVLKVILSNNQIINL